MQILIADDDIELCSLLKEYLEQECMQIDLCHDGLTAVEMITEKDYELLILDVMMPVKNGFDTLSEIRKTSSLPIIMLTAKGEKIDRIVGLEMGADDYVAKPCDPRELVARIRAVTRRAQNLSIVSQGKDLLQQGDLVVNRNNRQVLVSDNIVELTSTEFDFLLLLLESAGTLVTRKKLSLNVLGKRLQSFDRSIDMHISNLRKKLGPRSDGQERIKTLRGNGYQYLI
jgi:two-component system response regulator CpxR